jgi:hypothetical protein
MKECICSSCANLKGVINENGAVEEYECEFGYPDDACLSCEVDECEYTCNHFRPDDETIEPTKINCSKCGKELTQASGDDDDGEVFCIDCYLKQM